MVVTTVLRGRTAVIVLVVVRGPVALFQQTECEVRVDQRETSRGPRGRVVSLQARVIKKHGTQVRSRDEELYPPRIQLEVAQERVRSSCSMSSSLASDHSRSCGRSWDLQKQNTNCCYRVPRQFLLPAHCDLAVPRCSYGSFPPHHLRKTDCAKAGKSFTWVPRVRCRRPRRLPRGRRRPGGHCLLQLVSNETREPANLWRCPALAPHPQLLKLFRRPSRRSTPSRRGWRAARVPTPLTAQKGSVRSLCRCSAWTAESFVSLFARCISSAERRLRVQSLQKRQTP